MTNALQRPTRRAALALLLCGVAAPALAKAPTRSLRPMPRASGLETRSTANITSAETLVARAKLTGKTAFAVADAKTGRVLEAHNPLLPLPPASVAKAVTALYALDKLGPGYRFETRLIATGPIGSDGRIRGDLVLVGGGDPTLDTDTLGDMARALRKKGVKGVTGAFKVYDGALPRIPHIDSSQPAHVGYNPSISGLNLNFNRVHFEWKRQSGSYSLTMDARARRYRPEVGIAKMRVVDRTVPVYTYADKSGSDHWTVARGALGNGGSRWLPVRKPAAYAGDVFRTLARAQGTHLPTANVSRTKVGGTTLVQHQSAELKVILRDMLRWSTNLTAEVVGLAATGGGKGLKASARAMTDFARTRIGMKKAKFVDHSGLGGASRVSAGDMVRALAKVQARLGPILKAIAMRDKDGRVVADHPIKARAKTGTLHFTSTLAGYMTAPDGRDLVFVILSADVPRRGKINRKSGETPQGARGWRGRARRLQLDLIERWGAAYRA